MFHIGRSRLGALQCQIRARELSSVRSKWWRELVIRRNPAWTLKSYASSLAALAGLSVAVLNGEG